MKKTLAISLAGAVAVLLLSLSAHAQSNAIPPKSSSAKPGDKFVYECPEQQQPISLINVKDNDYVLFQGMLKTCLTRDDQDGYQNYSPQPGSFNYGVQVTPKDEVFFMKFGAPVGPCKLVRKEKGGYADPMCVSKK